MHDARKAWFLGDILTVTTGYQVSLRVNGHFALEEYLADRVLTPEERGEYHDEFKEALLEQYPEFRDVVLDAPLPDELWYEWLRRRVEEFGEYLPVNRLSSDHPVRGFGRTRKAGR
jgi:hypothetical protein